MKLYLAGKMRGEPDLNFPAFYDAAEKLRAAGYRVFNPAAADEQFSILHSRQPSTRECMGHDTQRICAWADGIALLPGWEESLGAQAEVALAKAIGIPHNWVSHWLSVAQREAA